MSRFDELRKYRVDGDEQGHPEQPEIISPERKGLFLCYDQALSRTGWVVLDTTDGRWVVLDSGIHATEKTGSGSLEDSYARSELLNALFTEQIKGLGHDLDAVIYEMPTVGPRKTTKAEAAHTVVMALRLACGWLDVPAHMMNVQQARKRLTGSADAEKDDVRAAVKEHAVIHHMPYQNEHTFDAAGNGIAFTMGDDQ